MGEACPKLFKPTTNDERMQGKFPHYGEQEPTKSVRTSLFFCADFDVKEKYNLPETKFKASLDVLIDRVKKCPNINTKVLMSTIRTFLNSYQAEKNQKLFLQQLAQNFRNINFPSNKIFKSKLELEDFLKHVGCPKSRSKIDESGPGNFKSKKSFDSKFAIRKHKSIEIVSMFQIFSSFLQWKHRQI